MDEPRCITCIWKRAWPQVALFRVDTEPSNSEFRDSFFYPVSTTAPDPTRMHAPPTPMLGPPMPATRNWQVCRPFAARNDDIAMPLLSPPGGWTAQPPTSSCFAYKTPQKCEKIGRVCCIPLLEFINRGLGRLNDLANKGSTANKRQKPNLYLDFEYNSENILRRHHTAPYQR